MQCWQVPANSKLVEHLQENTVLFFYIALLFCEYVLLVSEVFRSFCCKYVLYADCECRISVLQKCNICAYAV